MQQKRRIEHYEASARFEDLKLVPNVNLNSISDVTPTWLDGYVGRCEQEMASLRRQYSPHEAKQFEIQIKSRMEHVRHLCGIIFASRDFS